MSMQYIQRSKHYLDNVPVQVMKYRFVHWLLWGDHELDNCDVLGKIILLNGLLSGSVPTIM